MLCRLWKWIGFKVMLRLWANLLLFSRTSKIWLEITQKDLQAFSSSLHLFSCKKLYSSSNNFQIATDETVGRYLQSTKEIKIGSIIFSEFPLVVGPDWSFRHANCVGCFAPIENSLSRCPECQWPCCRSDCVGLENSKLHKIECLLLKGGFNSKHERNFYRTDVLFTLKCLMLQTKNPRNFDDLMNLEKNFEARKSSENFM